MTIAEKMREITNRVVAEMRIDAVEKNRNYVTKLIDQKVERVAEQGYSKTVVKIPRKYSALIVTDQLKQRGFKATRICDNGKQKIRIEW